MESPHKGVTGVPRLKRACRYSWEGLCQAYSTEEAFRQEVLIALVLVPLALWLGPSPVAKLMLIGSLFLVLIVELLNSAIETTVDRVSYDDHPLAKRAKDVSSAAVMLSVILAVVVWVVILGTALIG